MAVSVCRGPLDPGAPAPYNDPRHTRPLWTLADVDSNQTVIGTVTLWRSLPPGVSQAVADRTAPRTPTDGGDPGTVLEPTFEPVAVRGTTGTLVHGADAAAGDAGTALVWTAPDGQVWSVTGRAVERADLLDVAQGLAIDGDRAEPGSMRLRAAEATGAAGTASDPGTATHPGAAQSWVRLDVPQQGFEPAGDTTVWEPSLMVSVEGPGGVVSGMSFTTSGLPWQADPEPGSRLVTVDGGPALAVGIESEALLRWTLPSGANAVAKGHVESASGAPTGSSDDAVAALVRLAEALRPVPADDPRLTANTPGTAVATR
jgi:hypothetical protein